MTEAPPELLERAAARIRQRAETEAVLRTGDPYYDVTVMPDGTEISEASAWDRVVTPEFGLAVAELLDNEARNARMMRATTLPRHIGAVVRALSSEESR